MIAPEIIKSSKIYFVRVIFPRYLIGSFLQLTSLLLRRLVFLVGDLFVPGSEEECPCRKFEGTRAECSYAVRMNRLFFAVSGVAAVSLVAFACTTTINNNNVSDSGTTDSDSGSTADGGVPSDGSTASDAKPGPSLCPATVVDAGVPVVDAGKDGGSGPACSDPEQASTFVTRGLPKFHPGTCTDKQRTDLFAACLGQGSSQKLCDDFQVANTGCFECILGPSNKTPNPAALAAPALIPLGSVVVLNQGACAAAATGNFCCGPLLSDESICTGSVCETCESNEDVDACTAAASAGVCAPQTRAASGCAAGLEAQRSSWEGVCNGADFNAGYEKVTKALCGTP